MMQNPIFKIRQSFIISKKSGHLSEKLKTLTSSNYHRELNTFAEILHSFPTYKCLQKVVWDFFILFIF